MLQIDTADDKTASSEQLKRTAADIAMHITATKPLAMDKNGIDPKVIEQEKSIYAEQVKNKPANIVEKIVEGKLKKFYEENCLLEQKFVKDDTKTVAQVLEEAAKQAGGSATIKRFVRFDVG
jgi:elongation factor Ts